MNEQNFETFDDGVSNAIQDIKEGWIYPEDWTKESLSDQLILAVGASEAYIAGYNSVVFSR